MSNTPNYSSRAVDVIVEQALIPVRAEVGRLRTALLRYGVHRHHCATSLTPPQGGAVPVCNCGYHDALATDTEGE